MAREAIRTLRVTVQEDGAAKTAASIERVGDAVAETGAKIQGFSRVVDRELKKGMVGAEVATDGLEKKTRVLNRSVEGLQRSLDPAYRSMQQMAKVERDLGLARDQGLISLGRQNELLMLAQDRYGGMAKSAVAANQNVKLTSGQVQNLGYQLNDVATMLAMGASPFQVISSQAGQVVQSLGDGPGGVKGSLNALKDSLLGVLTRIGPLGIAFGAAGAAAAAYALMSQKEVRPVSEIVTDQEKRVKALAEAWGLPGKAVEDYAKRGKAALQFDVESGLVETTNALGQSTAKLIQQLTKTSAVTDGIGGVITTVTPKFAELAGVIGEFQRSGDVKALDNALGALGSSTPNAELKAFIATLSASRQEAVSAAAAYNASADALDRLAGKGGRISADPLGPGTAKSTFGDRMGGRTALDDRMNVEGLNDIREGLKAQTEEMTKANKVGEDYRKGVKDRAEATRDSVVALQLELKTVGMTTPEAAALRFEYEAVTEAKRAAAEAGMLVGDKELAYIKEAAGRVGEFTAAIEKAREEKAKAEKLTQGYADLAFERDQITRSPTEQKVFDQLKSLGVAYDSLDGQRIAGEVRYNEALQNTQDQMQDSRDAAKDFVDTLVGGLTSGESVLKSLTNAFAGLGQKLASNGLNMLFDGLMGGGSASSGGTNSLGGIASSIGQFLSGGSSSKAAAPTYSAPTVAVERGGALPAIVTGAGFSQSKAASVAGQSVPVQMWNFFAGKGLASHQIAGILGNAQAESAFNPKAVGDNGQAFGLFQHNDRASSLFQAIGGRENLANVGSQLEFVWKEFQTTEKSAFTKLLNSTTIKQANDAMIAFERPAGSNKGAEYAHNYSGRLANSEAAYAQFSGGANDNRQTSRAVADGMETYAKKAATGGIPGVSASSQVAAGPAAVSAGGSAPGVTQANTKLGQGMEALGAGLGIFANAYQGGSPVGGAVSGALGGWSAGAAIAGVGGPVGAVVGGIVGLIGGIFGGKSQKKKEAQQRDIEAGKAWEAAFPKLIELSDYVDMEEKGSLSQELADIEKQLVEFRKLAVAQGKEKGHKDAINNVATVTAQAKTYGDRLKAELRGVAGTRSEELAGGLGLDTDFEKARTSIKETSKQYLGYISDVKLAFAVPDDQTGAINAAYDKSKSAIEAAEKAKKEATGTAAAALARSKLVDEAVKSGNASILKPGNSDGQLAAAAAKRDAELAAYNKSVEGALDRYNNAVAEAYSAARAGLLAIVSGNIDKPTDVEAALDQARGAAVAMQYALQDLGMSADDAAKAIDGALTTRIKSMGEAFKQDLQDSIDGLDGKGYLADFRELIKGIVDTRSDASLLNVDTSLVDTFFQKQAQALVDGSELTGDAFAELIKAFPSLSGVVHEFSDVIVSTAAEIADRMQGYGDRIFAATNDNTSLAGTLAAFDRQANYDREAEAKAGGAAMVDLEKALAAERLKAINDWAGISLSQKLADATAKRSEAEEDLRSAYDKSSDEMQNTIDRLKGLRDTIKDFLTSIRLDDEKSPLSGFDQVTKAQQDFRDIQAKALAGDEEAQGKLIDVSQSYLDEARDYYASSESYFAIFNEVEAALKSADVKAGSQLTQTEQQLAAMKTQVSSLISIDDGVKSVADAIKDLAAATKAQRDAQAAANGGRNFGANPVRNQLIDAGVKSAGLNYTGNYGFQADGSDPFAAWRDSLAADQRAKVYEIIGQYIGINRQTGGLIPGYVNGGMVGNGTWNRDSVLARYAGGGSIGLAGGEMVISAPKVTPQTYPVLQEINRTGRVPANGDGNGELIAEVRALRAEVRSLKAVTAEGSMLVASKVDEGNGHARSQASETKKRNAA